MNFPGFKAEASLYKSKELYRTNGIGFGAEGAVEPARTGFRCSMCDHICAGAPSFATDGVVVPVAVARAAAILIDRNCGVVMRRVITFELNAVRPKTDYWKFQPWRFIIPNRRSMFMNTPGFTAEALLKSSIGAGAMREVYKACGMRLNRTVQMRRGTL